MEGRRVERLGGQIQQEVSEIISRKIKDPRLGFVTVTAVRMTRDLRYASIYVSVIGDESAVKNSISCLEGAASFIRHELGKRLHIRHIPELRFRYDESPKQGARIEGILRKLKEGRDAEGSE